MPTLRQAGISPQTEKNLAGTVTHNNKRPHQEVFIPIRTPSALLSRDPMHLSSTLQVSLDNIRQLRSSVAEFVISDPFIGHGGRANEIIDCVTKFRILDDGNDNDANDGHVGQSSCRRRQEAITVGAVTALDLYAHTLLMKKRFSSNDGSNLEYIGTGSMALDQLLLDDDCNNNNSLLSFPYSIPNNFFNSCHNDDGRSHYFNDNAATASPPPTSKQSSSFHYSSGGIPFGYITEISGKPSSGKTQLALTITAQAVVVNKLRVKYLIAGGGGGSSRKAISRRLYTLCIELVRSQLLMQQQQQQQQTSTSSMNNFDKEVKSIALKCLERVSIATVPDAYTLLGSLVQIENEEASYNASSSLSSSDDGNDNHHHQQHHHRGTLLIIDSISGCLGHHIYSDLKVGASLSNQVAMTLRHMTRSLDGNYCFFDDDNSSVVHKRNASATWKKNPSPPPRRFAVVVINGTVGKGTNSNDISEVNHNDSSHKPAMGKYWQGGDLSLWLEEEGGVGGEKCLLGNNASSGQMSSFYDCNVAGLSRSNEKVVTAKLLWHYGKSVPVVSGDGNNERSCHARFAIQAGGVVDVE